MIHSPSKRIRPSHFIVLSAGILLQAYSALASEPLGDAQAQARALLNPPVGSRVRSVEVGTSTRTSDHVAPRADAQEFAHALLSGDEVGGNAKHSSIVRNSAGESTQSKSAQGPRVYFDAQQAARRMILGIGEPVLPPTHLAVAAKRDH